MKKILFLAIALVVSVCGAWADPVYPEAGKTYKMHCLAVSGHTAAQYVSITNEVITHNSATGSNFIFEDAGENKWYIKDAGSNKYLYVASATSGTAITLSAEATTYWTAGGPFHTNGIRLYPNGNTSCWMNNNNAFALKTGVGECSSWVLEEVTVNKDWVVVTSIAPSTNVANPEHVYTLTSCNDASYKWSSLTHPVTEGEGSFAFYSVADKNDTYRIYSINEGKWLTYNKANSNTNMQSFITVDEETQDNAGYFKVTYVTGSGGANGVSGFIMAPYSASDAATGKYLNWNGGIAGCIGKTLGLWQDGNTDKGSIWTVKELQEVEPEPEAPEWCSYNDYDVKSKGANALTAIKEGYIAILGMDQSSASNKYLYDNGTKVQGKVWADKTPELVWYVKSNGSGKYSFRNFKTGKYMTITRSNGGALNTSTTETNLNFLIQNGYGFIDDGSYGVDVAWSGDSPTAWSGHGYTASGSRRLKIYEVELMPATAKAEITYNYVFEGDNVGSETFQATIGEAFPDPTKSFGGYTMSAKPEGNVAEAGSHTITLTYNGPVEFTTISEGAFAAGTKWYRMQNGNNNENGYVKYLNDESKRSVMTSTEGSTDDYLWCFVRKPHTTYFYLYNRMAGAEVALHEELSTNTGWAASHNQGFGVFKVEGANDMPLEFVTNTPGYTMKLAGVEGTCVLGKHVGSNLSIWGNGANTNDNGSRFTFTLTEPEAGSYTLNVGETGYATLYLDENVTVPEGVEVYLCTSEDGTKIDATAFDEDDVLQGYMGYVVKAEPNTNVEFTYTGKNYEGSLDIIDNVLFGVLVETAVTSLPVFQQTPYVLSVVQGHVGFYKFGGETLKANRAFYVPVGGAADVQGFVIDFGGLTTGINAAQQAQSQKASFDLQGRRVSKATRGLFIQNGQKVIR